MSIDVSPLFQSLEVRGNTFRNRIVMPPMVVNRGITTPAGIEWYARRAQGGVALVIVEATSVDRFGDDLTPGILKPLVDAVHDWDALVAIQLFPVERGRPVAPAELSREDLDHMVAQFRTATEMCVAAGFDGVEPHGAHGYALNQFFSPSQNSRKDEFGGSLENRMRLALRIVHTIRPALPERRMLLYRHTPQGPGYAIAESLVLARELVAAGVDLLDLSPSSEEAPGDLAAPFKPLGVPVIAVNELDRIERALEVLHEDRADLIAVGRGLIADPDWPIKVRRGSLDEIQVCVRCDDGCFGNLRRGIPVVCSELVD